MEEFPLNFLRNFTTPAPFSWKFLPAKGTTRGILVEVRDENFLTSSVSLYNSAVNCSVTDKKNNFDWTLVVVYGPPHEGKKVEFIDELQLIMSKSNGHVVVGGDFNLSRFASDKSSGRIVQKFVDCFNDWINK
jgi:regulation of enolase protein 1 (concanavalin A-like superfamily)